MDLCDLNTIRLLLGRHGFRFSRSMGQNFLIEGRRRGQYRSRIARLYG